MLVRVDLCAVLGKIVVWKISSCPCEQLSLPHTKPLSFPNATSVDQGRAFLKANTAWYQYDTGITSKTQKAFTNTTSHRPQKNETQSRCWCGCNPEHGDLEQML